MDRRYGRIVIAVAIVGVAAGGTTAAVEWANSGDSPSSASAATPDARPASVLGLQTAKPTPPTPPSSTAPAPAISTPAAPTPTAVAPAPKPPITYVVKQGDNLSVIAAWFKLHGYGDLYQANMSVIGDNPNLIFAGQRLTIANGTMTVSSP